MLVIQAPGFTCRDGERERACTILCIDVAERDELGQAFVVDTETGRFAWVPVSEIRMRTHADAIGEQATARRTEDFATFLRREFADGFAFVSDLERVADAQRRFPREIEALARVTARHELLALLGAAGFPAAAVEASITPEAWESVLRMIMRLRASLASVLARGA